MSLDEDETEKEVREDLFPVYPMMDWKGFCYQVALLDSMKPTSFWKDKVPDSFLPFVGTVEYLLRRGAADARRDLELSWTIERSIERVLRKIFEEEHIVSSTLSKVLEKFISGVPDKLEPELACSLELSDEELVRLVGLCMDALNKRGNLLQARYEKGFGGKKRLLERYRSILSWVLEGRESLKELTELYSKVYALLLSNLWKDLRLLVQWKFLVKEVLGPGGAVVSLENLTEYVSKDVLLKGLSSQGNYQAEEIVNNLVGTLDKMVLDSTYFRPAELLKAGGLPSLESLYFYETYSKWNFWQDYPYGIRTWEEVRSQILTELPERHYGYYEDEDEE
jgi:hypothetical protein